MKRKGTLACVVFAAVAGIRCGLAQGLEVDWKLYGGAAVGGENLCFYDAKGLTQLPGGHIRVWTKCLLKKDMDSIDIEKDFGGRILKETAEKVAHYYVPPIAKIQDTDANDGMAITGYEEIADISVIQPQSRIFYELNCSDRMLRELSIDLHFNGQSGSSSEPSDWKYVPPEGNGASLLKILCPLR
jgi:hypothetical protein